MRRTTDQHAAHDLMLSCRRLDTAIESGDPHRGEAARFDTMQCIGDLLREFGLEDLSAQVLSHQHEFDGRHIEIDAKQIAEALPLSVGEVLFKASHQFGIVPQSKDSARRRLVKLKLAEGVGNPRSGPKCQLTENGYEVAAELGKLTYYRSLGLDKGGPPSKR